MEELKPCPFCGGVAVFNEDKFKHGTVYSVYCDVCCAEIAGLKKQEVVKVWNRRAT